MGKITISDFGTSAWIARKRNQTLLEAELAFYKNETEKMSSEIETMTEALKNGEQVIFAGMTITAVSKSS